MLNTILTIVGTMIGIITYHTFIEDKVDNFCIKYFGRKENK